MNTPDRLAKELFGDATESGEFKQYTSEKEQTFSWADNSEVGDPMSLNQWKRVVECDEIHETEPNGWRGRDRSMLEDLKALEEQFGVKVLLGGQYSKGHTTVDTAWVHYDTLPEEQTHEFERFAVIRFRSTMDGPCKGVHPDDSEISISHEMFRTTRDDSNLWASTDEFEFRENEEWGKYLRMWWDD